MWSRIVLTTQYLALSSPFKKSDSIKVLVPTILAGVLISGTITAKHAIKDINHDTSYGNG